MGVFIGEFCPSFFSFFCVCYHPLTYPLTQLDGTSKEAQSGIWTGSSSCISSCLTGATLRRQRRADVGTDDSVGSAGGGMGMAGGVGGGIGGGFRVEFFGMDC